jgi:hypothetical protein
MDSFLLFRKKASMADDGLPWLKGGDEFKGPDFSARRNTTGRVGVGYLIVRALMVAAGGNVTEAGTWADGVVAVVGSRSDPGTTNACWSQVDAQTTYAVPHGEPEHATYHLPLLWILEAVAAGRAAVDFWEAYAALLASLKANGKTEALKPALVRAADELYFWGRYHNGAVDKANDRFPNIIIADSGAAGAAAPARRKSLPIDALTDQAAIKRLLTGGSSPRRASAGPVPTTAGGFVGWQVKTLGEALTLGLNTLLIGPTGTGKNRAVDEAVLSACHQLITVEGKEGLADLDTLGAILPQPDNTRRWVDGPFLRAMRLAQTMPVVLFLDEITRIPRRHLNILLGVMNPKSREICERQGLAVEGEGPFYVTEVPMTSEVVWAPVANLRFVAAGNLGADYAVTPFDPAVRRRFDIILEFDYLELDAEKKLVVECTGLDATVAHAVCLLAQRTREMRRNADLPGCIDTGSVLTWARLCAARKAATLADVLAIGKLVWADVACGRDHLGQVNSGKFDGLVDYLSKASLKLPPGNLSKLNTWTF